MAGNIDKMASLAEWLCRDANMGYDQWNRWDFPEIGDVGYPGECDCSSLVYWCAKNAGFDIAWSANRYTGTELKDFQDIGFKLLRWQEVGKQENLIRGDILYKENHTAIWTGDGIAEAYADENGNAHSGLPGDQHQETEYGETRISPYRGGWSYVLRFPQPSPVVEWGADDDHIIEEGCTGNRHQFDQSVDGYWCRWEKWSSGTLRCWVSDYFNPAEEQMFGTEAMQKKAKPFVFPSEVGCGCPEFVENPWMSRPSIRGTFNHIDTQWVSSSTKGADFWVFGEVANIPKFSFDVELVGSWR